jgi:hypothetical protein
MTDETPRRDELPALGDPDDDYSGDFATEHQTTTVDNDEDETAGPVGSAAPPADPTR